MGGAGLGHPPCWAGTNSLPVVPPTGSPGGLDGGEDSALDGLSLSGDEGGPSEPDESADGDASSASSSPGERKEAGWWGRG